LWQTAQRAKTVLPLAASPAAKAWLDSKPTAISDAAAIFPYDINLYLLSPAPVAFRFTCARTVFQHSKSVQNAAFPPRFCFANMIAPHVFRLFFRHCRTYEDAGHL
jgi:hypothetical protein